MDFDEVKCTFEANVYGPMLICQAFTKLLIPTRGLIVNISSASTIVPYLWGAIYSASKGAINVYSLALRMELKPLGVRVMVAITGNVKSNLASHSRPVLPSNSLYRPVQDMFEERLTFSQTQRSVPADYYATQLASVALKDGGCFGGLFGGTPNYFYGGGMIQQARISTLVPQWIADRVIARFSKAHLIAKRIREATKND
jgi:1-acylglycerone phosphate reductase